ncbi:Telomerase Cajal body protein 1 [Phlyctochytrium bullatum]|nr:Telomerase Cajal body protein 1 [Phlyctochytrium bullatum]
MDRVVGTAAAFHGRSVEELRGTRSSVAGGRERFHFKNAVVSPDGFCVLTNSNDNVMRVFDINLQGGEIKESLKTKIGGAVYDYAWYPLMHSLDQPSCCFVTSVKDHPIQLWDAYTGTHRASYTVYASGDCIRAPHSVCFSPNGGSIAAGLERRLVKFDTSRPGDEYEELKTALRSGSKKKRKYGQREGQKGIISAVKFSDEDQDVLSFGTFLGELALFDFRAGSTVLETHVDTGVTQIEFYGSDIMLVATRKSSELLAFDIRAPDTPLQRFPRSANTNQRLHFDISRTFGKLGVGDTLGTVTLYDLHRSLGSSDPPVPDSTTAVGASAVCAVSFHPFSPFCVAASGSRRTVREVEEGDGSDSEGEKSEGESESGSEGEREEGECGEEVGEEEGWSSEVSVWSFVGSVQKEVAQEERVEVALEQERV